MGQESKSSAGQAIAQVDEDDALCTVVERLEDQSPPAVQGSWLRHHRPLLRSRYADGTVSDSYVYEYVSRRAMDAVVVVLHHEGQVLLRTALRPPLAFRAELATATEEEASPVLWELPAGLIEADEGGAEGIARCALREAEEETGYRVSPDALERLGPPTFLSPGVAPEQLHFYAAAVASAERVAPVGDGTPLEDHFAQKWFGMEEALSATLDAKSELGLRRWAARTSQAGDHEQ